MTLQTRIAKALHEAQGGDWNEISDNARSALLQKAGRIISGSDRRLATWVRVHWIELGFASFLLGLGVFVALIFLIARTIP